MVASAKPWSDSVPPRSDIWRFAKRIVKAALSILDLCIKSESQEKAHTK